MKIRLFLTTISMVCQLITMLQAEVNDAIESKWVLFNQDLFYIDSRSRQFISTEAQQYCIDSKMNRIIQSNELVGLSKLLIGNYDFDTTWWLLDEDFSSNSANNGSVSDCYALSATGVRSAPCLSLKGVICKQEIYGGSLQYKNGSHLEVGVGDVNQFCNPESNQYDELLEFCLIKMHSNVLLL